MSQPDFRQDKQYRRGLILGLTIAEVMILLTFILLMALASALANREKRIEALQSGVGSRLVEELQRAYPNAKTPDDYFKELVRAVEARKMLEAAGGNLDKTTLIEDAQIGQAAREVAKAIGEKDPAEAIRKALLDGERGKKGKWPPFFNLSEAGGYYFDSGKATLRPAFEQNLRTAIIPLLRQNIDEYGVDVVEVIGHTDEVPMTGLSNLDGSLIAASANRLPTAALRSSDNAGLAMARAVAVVKLLKADPRLKGVAILPLSGAQMIVPVDRLASGTAKGDDQRRRRIEIRLRRSTGQQMPVSGQSAPASN